MRGDVRSHEVGVVLRERVVRFVRDLVVPGVQGLHGGVRGDQRDPGRTGRLVTAAN